MFQASLIVPSQVRVSKNDHIEQAVGWICIRQQGDAGLEPADVADHNLRWR